LYQNCQEATVLVWVCCRFNFSSETFPIPRYRKHKWTAFTAKYFVTQTLW